MIIKKIFATPVPKKSQLGFSCSRVSNSVHELTKFRGIVEKYLISSNWSKTKEKQIQYHHEIINLYSNISLNNFPPLLSLKPHFPPPFGKPHSSNPHHPQKSLHFSQGEHEWRPDLKLRIPIHLFSRHFSNFLILKFLLVMGYCNWPSYSLNYLAIVE